MLINDEIEYLHRVITGVKKGDIISYGIFDRMFSWGILSMFNEINNQLEELIVQLDSALNLEALSIDFDLYLNKKYWTENWLYVDNDEVFKESGIKAPKIKYTTQINKMTDYLPNGVKGYQVTANVLESFKTAMHQLCDEDRFSFGEIYYGLTHGLEKMLNLLEEVKRKVKNPKIHLYKKLWDETLDIYDDDEFDLDYKEWLDEVGNPSFEELKARQKQEIFRFLNKNFLRFCKNPTGAEVKNRKLIITEDDLPYGTLIPDSMEIECAKLERFVEWKEEHILTINYEKLGQYIYKYYHQFELSEFFDITNFDRILDVIHEAMAKIKPQLAPCLKRYEENKLYELAIDCKRILNTCKPFLNKNVRDNILDVYIDKILYDPETKEEARSKLTGQSKNKYICDMVAHLHNFHILDLKYNSDELAGALYKEINSIEKNTLNRYIADAMNSRRGALYTWTKEHIDEFIAKENDS